MVSKSQHNGVSFLAYRNGQTVLPLVHYTRLTHPVGDQPALLGFQGIPVDRVAKVNTPAAFHDREREPTPSVIEAAEALAWEANRLHLSQSAYRVDDGTVPDAYFRTLIAARRTFQTREHYERTKGCLEQLPGERPEANSPKHAGADSYYEAIDLVCREVGASPLIKVTIGESYIEDILYGESFKQPPLNDELSQSNEGAICTAKEKQPETAVEGIAQTCPAENIL
ncbi:hypothetical protein HO173_006182 [Letharia columbiana]|uniref:Uncharacterized protein n=1 Tax=Letharia columbiana TaxID=112416 RepID=A0A8H6FVD8_9LECA|nr:uncharacterized protein HO173_006182 [Letharia columbiana]KAF6235499.1 hypothetical protein HO173_006182 [Letharia columbiana]